MRYPLPAIRPILMFGPYPLHPARDAAGRVLAHLWWVPGSNRTRVMGTLPLAEMAHGSGLIINIVS